MSGESEFLVRALPFGKTGLDGTSAWFGQCQAPQSGAEEGWCDPECIRAQGLLPIVHPGYLSEPANGAAKGRHSEPRSWAPAPAEAPSAGSVPGQAELHIDVAERLTARRHEAEVRSSLSSDD